MTKENDVLVNQQNIGAEFLATESEQKTKVVRALNPLLVPLELRDNSFQRFTEYTNKRIKNYSGIAIGLPRQEQIAEESNYKIPYIVVSLPYQGEIDEQKLESLRNLLRSFHQIKTLQEGDLEDTHFITNVIKDYANCSPNDVSGFVVKNKASSDSPKENILEIRMSLGREQAVSEVDLAYETVMSSLVLAGKIDLSSDDALKETFNLRKQLFLSIYRELLEEMMPLARREDIYGLDTQIADIETNLYNPLKKQKGEPMNTLLAGSPGVGKTFVGSFFASQRDVLTVPLSIDYLEDFDRHSAPQLSRIKNAFDVPIVILVEDIEGLLEAGISVDSAGQMSQIIDPKGRSRALSLLERMQDTHKMYLLCSLNHPDVEAAFLRRFNTIYFPLPSSDQRRIMLEKIIKQDRLSGSDHQRLVEEFIGLTEGFNYSGLSLIADYVTNIELANDGQTLSGREYENALKASHGKAKSRLDKAGLARFDKAARKMVGLEDLESK